MSRSRAAKDGLDVELNDLDEDGNSQQPSKTIMVNGGTDTSATPSGGSPANFSKISDQVQGNLLLDQEDKSLNGSSTNVIDPESKQTESNVTAMSIIVPLTGSLLGAGVLDIPNTFINTGIIPSTVLMMIIAILGVVSTHMVIVLQHKTNSTDFVDLVTKLLGKWGSVSLILIQFFFQYTGQIVFGMVAEGVLISIFNLVNIDVTGKKRLIMCCIYFAVYPIMLTLPKNKSVFNYLPPFGIFSCTVLALSLGIKSAIFIKENKGFSSTAKLAIFDANIFCTIAVYAYSFALPIMCLGSFGNYKKTRTRSRLGVASLSILLNFILIFAIGLFGYIVHGADTKGNIFASFPDNDEMILVSRILFFFVVSTAYSATANGTASLWGNLFFNDGNFDGFVFWKRILLLFFSHVIPVACVLVFVDGRPALIIGGAMGGCVASFVYPSILWIVESKQKWYTALNFICILFAIFGIISAAAAIYLGVNEVIYDIKHSDF